MSVTEKGKSPFYPGQPVPTELFVGRASQIDQIMSKGVGQVVNGKPVAIYVQGDYGIGKSSIAAAVRLIAERDRGLHGINVLLGGAESLDEVGEAVLRATVQSGAFDPKRSEKIRELLAKYIGEQSLFGITLRVDALKRDAPTVASASNLLSFLDQAFGRLKETGVKGIFLVLDEINGIASNPKFSHFIKTLVDSNALRPTPLPLLLMLCGVEDRRREMIRHHQPIERVFEIVDIKGMSEGEMHEFFLKAFNSVHVTIEPKAMATMKKYSAGFPKIMHLVGDAAFWLDRDSVIDEDDAEKAVIQAADDVGKKYVDQQVYKALRSKDYHSILGKIAKTGPHDMVFRKQEIAEGLTSAERKKFDNFLQKMKKLQVIRQGDIRGEYAFNLPMVRLYISLDRIRKDNKRAG